MNSRSNPTLLVFTLGPAAESARRGLLPAAERALERELWGACLTAALDAGRARGCRLEVCSPAPLALPPGAAHVGQPEGPFGARLESALDDAFARGAGPVVVVGTDIPGLSAFHVERALAALADDPDRVVLGPSPDGGFYLLACRRPIEGLAGATRWRGRRTMRGLVRSLRAAGRTVELLEPLQDLDGAADLERWLAARALADAPRSMPASAAGCPRSPWPRAGARLPSFCSSEPF
jgi:2-phospho-L-lactate guanylyltransferase (CobY/MobA/RfbA family)